MYLDVMESFDYYLDILREYSEKVESIINKFEHLFTTENRSNSENRDAFRHRGLAKMLPRLVGRSTKSYELHQQIQRKGNTDKTVLISGETGTGKELVARCIHYYSSRHNPNKKNDNFFVVNCSSFLEGNLLYSELFGHVRGAFTGATQKRFGLFGKADGGTLFLDEIGSANMYTQQCFLRVLETGEYKPLGSDDTIKCNVRVIAATNVPLKHNPSFRRDLYYRLGRPISIPPLRDRKEEIIDLAYYFLNEYCRKEKIECQIVINRDVCSALERYNWPGNVRELKQEIEEAIIQSEDDPGIYGDITIKSLPDFLRQFTKTPTKVSLSDRLSKISEEVIEVLDSYDEAKDLKLSQRVNKLVTAFEKASLLKALKATGGNITKAAKDVKVDRKSFYVKSKKYNL